jgi:hypothetical protein
MAGAWPTTQGWYALLLVQIPRTEMRPNNARCNGAHCSDWSIILYFLLLKKALYISLDVGQDGRASGADSYQPGRGWRRARVPGRGAAAKRTLGEQADARQGHARRHRPGQRGPRV